MEHVVTDCGTKQTVFIPLTPDEVAAASQARLPSLSDYSNAIQAVIDQTAQAHEYADGVTLASYVASTVPQWAAQALAFVAWRDAVWAYAYAQLAAVQGGLRSQPSVAVLVSELPVIAWPS